MFRASLYARVSTNDQQTLAMQNRAMREYAVRRGLAIAMQVHEVNSGAAKREACEKLLDAARRWEKRPRPTPCFACGGISVSSPVPATDLVEMMSERGIGTLVSRSAPDSWSADWKMLGFRGRRDENYRKTESMYLRYAGVRNPRDLQDAACKVQAYRDSREPVHKERLT